MDRSFFLHVLIALLATIVGALFTYGVLAPEIGFDDANITQAYAKNLAAGYGYVYNIGGERVEGSTSLLWTGINLLIFAVSERPEQLLAGVSFGLCFATILVAIRTGHGLNHRAPIRIALFCGALFLIFPGFFAWMIWSLMDTALWVLLIAIAVLLVQRATRHPDLPIIPWLIIGLLLPLARPEGIALCLGLALFYAGLSLFGRLPLMRFAFATASGGLLSFVMVTLWRLWYFGYPFPNTYYAKSATDQIWQLKQGLFYAFRYVQELPNIFFLLALAVAALAVLRQDKPLYKFYLWLLAYLGFGGGVLYILLGGDHFGGHRFYLYLLPLGLPLIATLWGHSPNRFVIGSGAGVAAVMMALAAYDFTRHGGHIKNEFRIAEDGRARGEILNRLPGSPVLGVIAAGGIRMTYLGDIQDLLGLNWTEVAHAKDDDRIARVVNHRSFNQTLFWENPPEIFIPYTGTCPSAWQAHTGFLGRVTDEISQTPAFRQTYAQYCFEGLVFHVSDAYLARIAAQEATIGWHQVEGR